SNATSNATSNAGTGSDSRRHRAEVAESYADYDNLEAQIRTLAGEINAAHARLAIKVADLTSHQRYNAGGDWRSVIHWLVVNCGMTRSTAQQVAHVAEAVSEQAMPTVMERASQGAVSLGMAAMAARVACPENDEALASIVTTATTPQAARAFRWYRKVRPEAEESAEKGANESAAESAAGNDGDGSADGGTGSGAGPDGEPDDSGTSTGDDDAPGQTSGSANGADGNTTAVPNPPVGPGGGHTDEIDVTDDDETYWRTWHDEHGFWRVNGRAPLELGALLDEAFEAARRSAQRNERFDDEPERAAAAN
ncbi:MAG: hypothetical protein KDB20_17090, partial [Microthrixaceae bacterium]|nr:hypothetical protein [Microthrixaceae bacterium]